MKKNQGFTLIELMIVIAIIAILMAYAIPAYRDYTVRAKAGECLTMMSAAKQSVTETYQSNGALPTSNTLANLADPTDINGKNVAQVEVIAAGAIVCTFSGPDDKLLGKTVTLTPDVSGVGSVKWACSSTLDPQYKPKGC